MQHSQHFSQEKSFCKQHLTGLRVPAACVVKCWARGNSQLPSKLRIYVGRRKETRTTFSLLPEQPVRCNPDHQPALTASFPVRWGGRTQRGHRGGETKGSWLWLEPSHLLLQIKDWDKKGFMPQVLRYHVIACHQLLLENLKLIPNATTLQGEKIFISVSQVRETTHHVGIRGCPSFLSPLSSLLQSNTSDNSNNNN